MPAEQAGALAVAVLGEQLPLRVQGYRYHDDEIYQVLVAAAAQ